MVSKTKTTNSSIIDELKDAVIDYQKASSVAAQQKVKKAAKFSFGQNSQTYHSEMVQNAQIDAQISSIVSQMNTLGYKEANGVATKL